jgi:hypothetical protein
MTTGEMASLGVISATLAGTLQWTRDETAPYFWRANATGPEGEAQILTLTRDAEGATDELYLQDWFMARGVVVSALRGAVEGTAR